MNQNLKSCKGAVSYSFNNLYTSNIKWATVIANDGMKSRFLLTTKHWEDHLGRVQLGLRADAFTRWLGQIQGS